MSGKRLLQLNVTANWGSTGKIAEEIGHAAMARGWESMIAYGRYMNQSQSKLVKVGNRFDVYAHYARHRLFDREGLGSARATRRLIERIKEYNPDIIHLHNIHDHWLNYPLLFQYLATIDAPIVWTFHDCWAFTGGCPHFDKIKCYNWRDNGCSEKCPLKHSRSANNLALRKKSLEAIGGRLTVICVSNWLADLARQSFLKDCGCNIAVLNNGISLDSVFNVQNIRKEQLILGVSSIWNADKGLYDFFKLREFLPRVVKFALVGLTPKQISRLPDGIRGIARTNSGLELASLYNRASVFVNPTYNDSFPTVNLEALACGTPVVTYRTGGSPEAVDEHTGIVVEKGDVDALAKAISKILDNPGEFSPESCRKRAERNFDSNTQFRKYIEMYESILTK